MNDDQPQANLDDAGLGRRDLLRKAAVGGALVWATPVVLAAPAAAEGLVSEIPGHGGGHCAENQVSKAVLIKYTPGGGFSSAPRQNPGSEGHCIAKELADTSSELLAAFDAGEVASECENDWFTSQVPSRFTATEHDNGDITVSFAPSHCTLEDLIVVKKAGSSNKGYGCTELPDVEQGSFVAGDNWFTVKKMEPLNEKEISHIEFAVWCCIDDDACSPTP